MRAPTFWAVAGIFLLLVARPLSAEPLVLDVLRATPGYDQRTREPIVSIYLRPASIKAFHALTSANVGRSIELRIDGRRVTKTVIGEPIAGGVFQVDGDFTRDQARDIASRISAGAARVEVEVTN